MLKALELVGFKSFVDRTRFDFPDGITVIVGPNGSGKSNIVDAIKWVLGSQSAKSLRGADMADVIFKGSAAQGRHPANSAEATLIFDNSDHQLPLDESEVYVTRRVYRSGEGEYLINRQPCRLKDVRDLFRGTGVGVDSYSLIEQGKVDRMLQASPKERRAIFEEAAGISRFKAKKVEAERRIARVEQNLLRLGDIVQEVRGRLDALKNQAAKAQYFREMTSQLSLLRAQLGLADRAELLGKQSYQCDQQASLLEQQKSIESELQASHEAAQRADLQLHDLAQRAQAAQHEQLQLRQRIIALESSRANSLQRMGELDSERLRVQSRLMALRHRANLTSEEVDQHRQQVEILEVEQAEIRLRAESLEKQSTELERLWLQQQHQVEAYRDTYMQLLKQANEQTSIITAEQGRLGQLEKTVTTRLAQMEQLTDQTRSAQIQLQNVQTNFDRLRDAAEACRMASDAGQTQLEELRRVLADRQDDAAALQGRLQGSRERLLVLQQLEEQQEGIGRGTQQLLDLAKRSTGMPWQSVRGMVADLIEIDLHLAPLIDVALGSSADSVVLADGQIIEMLRHGQLEIEGRASLMRMDRLPGRRVGDKIQLDGLRGVLGRADRLVHYQEEHEPLIRYLLGTTWLVDTLGTALDLSHFRGAGLKFVTASCEKIDADGTVILGSLQSALGLVARRSEMQAAREEIAHYEFQTQQAAQEVAQVHENIHELTHRVRKLEDDSRNASRELMTFTIQVESARSQLVQISESRSSAQAELDEARGHQTSLMQRLTKAHSESQLYETRAAATYASLQNEQNVHRTLDRQRRERSDEATAQRVLLARTEQRLEGLRATLEQLTRDQSERQQAVNDAREQWRIVRQNSQLQRMSTLEVTSQLSDLFLHVEQLSHDMRLLAKETSGLRENQKVTRKQLDALQRQLERGREKQNQLDLERSHIDASLSQLVQRFLEDYQIDLLDSELQSSTATLESREFVEAEVSRLRQDIAQVGAVNMEALRELDELQERFDTLDGHYQDLTEAKEALLRIITRINQDSRRLFLETLEAIRQNFQVLYRKSFGGGSADIVLEDAEDVLESGVEILATPPGKTALSNSLLSGGEKALTAVALIMAIFQFRPSPFCVLDEVDAPFDEANIGRFVSVLKDFLDWTKFIVVTHSKKTMTAATTLYGVTMQESGVSKQVAVRFEDVRDNGEIDVEEPMSSRRAA